MLARLRENSNVVTIAIVIMIIAAGTLIIDRPDNWLSIVAVVGSASALLIIFVSVRTVFKATVAIFVTLIGTALGFDIGNRIIPDGEIGVTWGLLYMFLLTATLSISYFTYSSYNRWSLAAITLIVSWPLMFMGVALTLNFWGLLLGVAIGLVFFVFFYVFVPRRNFKKMPKNTLTKKALAVTKKLENKGYAYTVFTGKKDSGYILTWHPDRPSIAYVLYPVKMSQPFGTIGREKRLKLSYKGKAINTWLLKVFSQVSDNKHVGVGPVIVIWDFEGSSNKTKVLGMSSPDYPHPIGLGFLEGNRIKLLRDFDDYAGVIKHKQLIRFEENDESKNTSLDTMVVEAEEDDRE